MGDRAPREDWGQAFRNTVSSARTGAGLVLLVDFPFVAFWSDGLAQVFFLVVGLVALVGLFPKSPLIPALIQWLPKLPVKGQG